MLAMLYCIIFLRSFLVPSVLPVGRSFQDLSSWSVCNSVLVYSCVWPTCSFLADRSFPDQPNWSVSKCLAVPLLKVQAPLIRWCGAPTRPTRVLVLKNKFRVPCRALCSLPVLGSNFWSLLVLPPCKLPYARLLYERVCYKQPPLIMNCCMLNTTIKQTKRRSNKRNVNTCLFNDLPVRT